MTLIGGITCTALWVVTFLPQISQFNHDYLKKLVLLTLKASYVYMTFFFQTNPIRVILKIVLAPPSLTMGINGCLLDPVWKTNKVRASVIKRRSHDSGDESF